MASIVGTGRTQHYKSKTGVLSTFTSKYSGLIPAIWRLIRTGEMGERPEIDIHSGKIMDGHRMNRSEQNTVKSNRKRPCTPNELTYCVAHGERAMHLLVLI